MQKANISGKSPAVSAVVYDRLKGVDFSTDPGLVAEERSPYAPNLVSGPGGYPEKRPGWRTLKQFDGAIYGIHSGGYKGEQIYLVHCGTKLYRWWPDGSQEAKLLYSAMPESYSVSFVHQDRIFLLTGKTYLFAGEKDGVWGVYPVSDIATVPTVFFNSGPVGLDGVPLQDRNILTRRRKVGFCGDGASQIFALPYEKLGAEPVVVRVKNQNTAVWETYIADTSGKWYFESTTVEQTSGEYLKIRDKWWRFYSNTYSSGKLPENKFVVERNGGLVGLGSEPWKSTSGEDNVEIEFSVAAEEEGADVAGDIDTCDTFTIFEERVFVTGNPGKKAFDWRSEADDPTYFPDTGYTRVGSAGTEIMGYLQVGTAQAIVKKEGNQDASVYLRTAGTLNDLAAFPIKQGVSGQGAISKRAFANILDDPMYLTRNGVFAVSSNIVTEQRTLVNRSRFIDPQLTRSERMDKAVACSWNGMYLLSMTDGNVYLMDGKQNKVYLENSLTGAGYNYECYHWTNVPATVWLPEGDILYFGTADGRVCRFNTDIEGVEQYNDDGAAIKAARATRVEFCGDFLRYKTLVKKGSGMLMQPYSRSSAKVYARTDKSKKELFFEIGLDDYDWDEAESPELYESWKSAQVVPFKKKLKKWKWLQLIVENDRVNEGFGVYGIILRHQKQNLI